MTTSSSSVLDDAATSSRRTREVWAAFMLAQLTFSRDRPSSAPCTTGWAAGVLRWCVLRSGESFRTPHEKTFLKVGYPPGSVCQCALKRSRLEKFFNARTLPLLFRSCFRVPRDDFPGGGPRRCWSSRRSSPGCPRSIRACSTTSLRASAPPVASLPSVRPPPAISLHLTHLRTLLLSCLPAASELPQCRFAETKHAPATPLADTHARASSGHHQRRRGGLRSPRPEGPSRGGQPTTGWWPRGGCLRRG